MINRNSIERRYKVTSGDPLGRGWEIVLSVSWFTVLSFTFCFTTTYISNGFQVIAIDMVLVINMHANKHILCCSP